MRSRYIALVGVVLAFAMIAAACGDSDTGEESTTTTEATTTTTAAPTTTTTAAPTTTTTAEPIELVIWADEKRAPVLEAAKEQVLAETGVALTIDLIDFDDLREQVTVAAPAGEGPDIFIGAHDWTGEMAANGISAPIDLGGRDQEWFPVSLEAFNYNGQLYGVPYATEAVALYYNTDLVPEAPKTIEDLTAACDGLTDIDNCWGIPGGGGAADAYHNYPFVSLFGGYIFNFSLDTGYDTTDVGLDSEGAIAGVTVLDGLVKDGYVGAFGYDDAKQLFLDGTQPFWTTGPWELGTLGDAEQTTVNWAVAQMPTFDGSSPGPFVGAQGFFINQFSENTGVAQAFLLDYVATEPVMTALYDADPRNPAFQATFDSVAAGNEVAAQFALSAAGGFPMPNIPEMNNVWGPLGDQLLGVRDGQTDPVTAMETAAQQVRDAIGG